MIHDDVDDEDDEILPVPDTVCGGVVQVMTHWCPPVTVPGATAVVTTV